MLQRALGVIVAAVTVGIGGVILITASAAMPDITFDGTPATPAAYSAPELGASYSVVGHTDGPSQYTEIVNEADVQHGPNCEPPGRDGSVTHVAPTVRDLLFQCANHVMTYGPSGTSAVRLTPNRVADFSQGTVTVDFHVSTLSRSSRDWLFVAVQNWDVQEQKITDEFIPSAKGNPRDTIMLEQGTANGFSSEPGTWALKVYDSNRNRPVNLHGASIDDAIGGRGARSAQVRQHFQLVINPAGHVKFWLPDLNYVITESAIPPITWSKGVVTFVHNTYSPDKGYNPDTGTCDDPANNVCGHANTWHWDNFNVNPNAPLTIVKTDHRSTDNAPEDTFQFAQPLPAGSVVRFEAWAEQAFVRFDNGIEVEATKVSAENGHGEHANSYLVPGVTGATLVHTRVIGTWAGRTLNNVEAYALGVAPSPTPTTSPTGTATPTATASPSPSPTTTPSPSPTPSASPSPSPTPSPVCNEALYRSGILEMGPVRVCP
jgi:hypothetical protein